MSTAAVKNIPDLSLAAEQRQNLLKKDQSISGKGAEIHRESANNPPVKCDIVWTALNQDFGRASHRLLELQVI